MAALLPVLELLDENFVPSAELLETCRAAWGGMLRPPRVLEQTSREARVQLRTLQRRSSLMSAAGASLLDGFSVRDDEDEDDAVAMALEAQQREIAYRPWAVRNETELLLQSGAECGPTTEVRRARACGGARVALLRSRGVAACGGEGAGGSGAAPRRRRRVYTNDSDGDCDACDADDAS